MPLSIGAKVNLGAGFALVLLFVVGVVSYRSTDHLVATTRDLVHSREVLEGLESLVADTLQAESSVRGFVIGGDEAFADAFRAARRDTEGTLAALRALIAGDPGQSARLAGLEPRLAAVMAWLDETARLGQEAGFEAAANRVRSGEGRRGMDAVRGLVEGMARAERALLAKRSAAAAATARQTVGVILGGTVLALVFLVSGSALVNREVRWRRAAEARIRESETRYRTLVDRVPIGLYRSMPDGRILAANPAMIQMLGYPDEAALRAAGAVALYADPAERARHVVDRLQRDGVLRDFEVEWRRADGSPIWVRNNVRAVRGADAQVHYEGAVEDVTEARRVRETLAERTEALEAAQEELVRKERLAVLGQLAGGVSHELRNPLGVIKNSAYYLRMIAPDDERMHKHLQILDREVGRATQIVTDLLDFARVTPPRRAATDVNRLVRDVIEEIALPPSVMVSLALDPAAPAVAVDRDQIALVLGNLVRNAAQAMPEGGTMTVRTGPAEGGAVVTVEDTGQGIAPGNLGKIFEPLFTTRAKGIGLGLAVAKGLAEGNGGGITAESEPGRGSRFAMRLPAAPAQE